MFFSHPHLPLSFFLSLTPPPPTSTLFPYTTLFRSPEYLRFVGRLRRLPEAALDEKIDRFLHLLDIFDDRYQTLSSYSKRSEEHTSELQSLTNLVCRLLLEKKKKNNTNT